MRATLWSLLPIYMDNSACGRRYGPCSQYIWWQGMRATLWSLLPIYMVARDAGDAMVPVPNIYGGRGCGRRYGPCSQYIWWTRDAGDAMVPAPNIYGGQGMRAMLWSLLPIYMMSGHAGDAMVPAPNIYGGRGCGRRYGPCSQYIWWQGMRATLWSLLPIYLVAGNAGDPLPEDNNTRQQTLKFPTHCLLHIATLNTKSLFTKVKIICLLWLLYFQHLHSLITKKIPTFVVSRKK